MKKIFKRYAKYLRENHLEELVAKNLEISKTMDIPLMRLFTHLTDEQLLEMGKPSMHDILLSIENGTFWEKAEETYKQWKEDKLQDISKHDIHPSDIVLINAVRKKGFLSFITSFSYDIDEISELMSEMDDFFRECDRTGMEVIYFIQKETENKYKESEERYRDLFENANDLIHIADIEDNILFANKTWLKTTDFTAEDIPKLNIQYIIHPDYLNLYLIERNKVISGKQPEEFVFAIISSSGKKIYLEGSISCQFDNGKAIGTRGIFTNITSKKINEERLKIYTKNLIESEERYRLILENVKDYAIFLINPEGFIMTWNNGAEQITGYSNKEIIGKHVSIFYPDDSDINSDFQHQLKIAIEVGKFQGESLRVKKDGTKFWANVVITALKDNDGNLKGFVKITRDVTERKQAEDAIKTSQGKLQAIFDYAPDAIIIADMNLNITGWNKAAEMMYGYSFEEVHGKNGIEYLFAEFTEPYTLEKALAEMNEKGSWTGEVITSNKYGERITIISSITTLYDEVGNPSEILSINKDIRERKESDEKISKTLRQLNQAQHMAHIGSWELDLETRVVVWSDEMYEIYGLEPFDHYPKSEVFRKYNHPDDQVIITEIIAKATKDKQPFMFNYRITDAKGNNKILHTYGDVICDHNGQAIKMAGTLQDITERKEAEDRIAKTLQQLNEAQQMAHIGSWEWDIATNEIRWSDELYSILGLVTNEFVPTYAEYLNYIHPDDKENVNGIIEEALKNKQAFKFDHKILRKDGAVRIANANGVVFLDNEGNVIKISGIVQDITERVISKVELKKAEDNLKAKQQFLSNMSHEIRTPLNSIIGFTKVVLKSNLNFKQREYLDAIKLSGQTLLVLINDILDLAKVDSGKMVFEKIPFKLSSSVSAMLHLFETKVQEKNIKLLNEYDKKIPEVLLGDPVRLHQIILNLISNAIKFTHKGKITLQTALIEDTVDSVKVEFSITDTGIGIHEDKLETIFEDFQQASSSTARLYGGTGLGLAIVKQLITKQGGTIDVQSTVNTGTTFTFWLPFKKASPEQLLEEEQEINEELSLKNISVLVVEDVDLNQLLIKAILDDFGCQYSIAGNGLVAIEKLEKEKYDIILMDLQMPEMNGFETTQYIRQNMVYPICEIPIIALTADVTTVDYEKCLALGINDYLSKPLDEKLLLNKMNKLLRQPFKVEEELEEAKEDRSNIREKCINLEYLKNKAKGNKELMKQMIQIYLEQTPELIKIMRQSFEKKDWEMLYKATHRIIPSFVMVGLDSEFENMAKKIQEFAVLQDQHEEIHSMLIKIEEICLKACIELKEEII